MVRNTVRLAVGPQATVSGLLLAVCAAALTGCGVNQDASSTATPVAGSSRQIIGQAYGGQQPINGAHVYVYATGQGGYGTASTSLLTSGAGQDSNGNYYVTTNANGGFNIATSPTCTVGTQAYLYVTGGNPGFGTNNAVALLAPLGACTSGTVNPPTARVQVNEVTTMVTAYALAGFAPDPTQAAAPAQAPATTHMAVPSGDTLASTGLANAMANALNIVDLGTGTVPATSPAGNAVLPVAKIYTLANALASCVNSAGPPNSTQCTTLLGDTNTTDTASAAIAIAKTPFANIADLYTLGSSANAPFAPALPNAPADLTLGLQYKTALYGTNSTVVYSAAFDSAGNLWTRGADAGGTTAAFVEYGPTGSVLNSVSVSDNSGSNAPFLQIGIDSTNFVWSGITGGEIKINGGSGAVTTLTNGSCAITNALTSTVFGPGGTAYAGDFGTSTTPASNIWEFSASNCTGSISAPARGSFKGYVAIEASGSLVSSGADASGNSVVYRYTSGGTESSYPAGGDFLSTDGSGNVWAYSLIGGNEDDELNEYNASNVGLATSGGYSEGGLEAAPNNIRAGAQGVHIDGGGNAWLAVSPCALGASCTDHVVGIPVNVSSSNAGITPGAGLALPGTTPGGSAETGAHALALDGSGNLWVAVADGSLIEYVGLTTPVATPILYTNVGAKP